MNNESKKSGAFMFTAVALACFIIIFNVLWIVTPKREFSESENRMLAAAAIPEPETLYNGAFGEKAEEFLVDSLPLRDSLISLRTALERALGAKENGGVYFGKDGYLFLAPSQRDEASLAANLAAMNGFARKNGGLRHFCLIAPNSVFVNSALLPANAPVPDQKRQLEEISGALEGIGFIDVAGDLAAHSAEYLYYRTDHHWTTLGSFYAFIRAAEAMGLDRSEVQYKNYTVTDRFEGTLASKSGLHAGYDRIDVCTVPDVNYSVNIPGSGKELSGTMYDAAALDSKDKYTVFFGGNYPLVEINTTARTGRRLLMFKDSYANCFVQFLIPHFDEIIMVDPRYFYDEAQQLVYLHGVTDVLYLYNLDTFNTDSSLYSALE